MPDSPARGRRGPTNSGDPSNLRVQKPMGLTPDIQGLDPRCAETGPPRDKATGPGIPDEDQGLRGIQDFVGFKTTRDP